MDVCFDLCGIVEILFGVGMVDCIKVVVLVILGGEEKCFSFSVDVCVK